MAVMKDTPANRKRGERALTSGAMERNNKAEAELRKKALKGKKKSK